LDYTLFTRIIGKTKSCVKFKAINTQIKTRFTLVAARVSIIKEILINTDRNRIPAKVYVIDGSV